MKNMNTKNNIEEKIMSQIKSGKVKLRSRYIFLAEKVGIGSAFVFSLLLAVLFLALLFFYLKSSDNLIYLSFGSRGLFAFLETFPYLLLVSLIISIFIAGFILKKSGVMYQKPFGYLAMGLIGFIFLVGLILTFTSLIQKLEERSYQRMGPGKFFRPFIHQEFIEKENGTVGRIIEIGENFVNIQTPLDTQKLDLSKVNYANISFKEGSFVVAIGEKDEEGNFLVENIKVINEGEMPMLRRGIHDKFGSFERREKPGFLDPQKRCLFDCVKEGEATSSCQTRCWQR